MDLSSVAMVVGVLNILFLGLNTIMVLNIKLAISDLRAEISENRRIDREAVHTAIGAAGSAGYRVRKAEGGV